jgi:UDP-N-acetylglucosamine--N-acetylmuramyl-(pentapeptide) pyrophosphoryl-undecaprenol N-acetylglucosamine transferase
MKRIILSGGGTGGHIYPAVAVAEALKRELGSEVELLFVGAEGKMEMDKIPALGYNIKGLPVAGLQRRFDLANFALPFKIARSLALAKRIIREFRADIVVGFGGYASAPILKAAQRMGIPTVIQEQNSYAGLTNKMLAQKAKSICVAYSGMERFFPPSKIVFTGNPLRGDFAHCATSRAEALAYFGFTPDRPVLMVVGGSLGSRTFNNMMKRWVERIVEERAVQVIWQTGKYYEREIDEFIAEKFSHSSGSNFPYLSSERRSGEARDDLKPQHTESYVRISNQSGNEASPPLSRQIWRGAFIERMDYAYSAADLVIARSGAITVSELCLLGKAVMFVPSPNVAEDHQTKNAMALVAKGAAEICPDSEAVERAIPTALDLIRDTAKLASLSQNIRALGIPDSAERIVNVIIK